jgi:hypothetical protein
LRLSFWLVIGVMASEAIDGLMLLMMTAPR